MHYNPDNQILSSKGIERALTSDQQQPVHLTLCKIQESIPTPAFQIDAITDLEEVEVMEIPLETETEEMIQMEIRTEIVMKGHLCPE